MNENFEVMNMNTNNAEIERAFETIAVDENNARVRYSTTTETSDLFNALSGKSEPVKNYIGETVSVVKLIATANDIDADRKNPDAGKVNKPIVHFFTADGKHISTLSNGIIRNVKFMLECGIIPTVENPINIRFDTVETDKGTAYIFDIM